MKITIKNRNDYNNAIQKLENYAAKTKEERHFIDTFIENHLIPLEKIWPPQGTVFKRDYDSKFNTININMKVRLNEPSFWRRIFR